MTCELRTPDKRSLDFIGHNLRKADLAEVRACGFPSGPMAIDYSVARSEATFLVVDTGRPVCVLGYAAHPNAEALGWGVPWMLGTDVATSHAAEIAALAGTIFDTAPYIGFAGFVLSANKHTLDILTERLGFNRTAAPVKLGVNGEPFLGLWRSRACPSPSSPLALQ